MNSILLKTSAKISLALMNIFAFYLLLRGHNYPGGGFVAGVLSGISFIFYTYTYSLDSTLEKLSFHPYRYLFLGVGFAIVSAIIPPIIYQKSTLEAVWWFDIYLPIVGKTKVGTPLILDLGVYLLVMGMCLVVGLSIVEDNNDISIADGGDSE